MKPRQSRYVNIVLISFHYFYQSGTIEDDWASLLTAEAIQKDHGDLPALLKSKKICPPGDCESRRGFIFPLHMLQKRLQSVPPSLYYRLVPAVANYTGHYDEYGCPQANVIECPRLGHKCFFESITCKSIPIIHKSDVDSLAALVMYDISDIHFCTHACDMDSLNLNLTDYNLNIFIENHTIRTSEMKGHITRFPFMYKNGSLNLLAYLPKKANPRHSLRIKGGNAGDVFSLSVVMHLLRAKGIYVRSAGLSTKTPYLSAVGSILQVVAREAGTRVVWGTGLGSEESLRTISDRESLIWQGVRGPVTRNFLIKHFAINPPVIGDPGIMAQEVHNFPRNPRHEMCFVFHKADVQDGLTKATLNHSGGVPWVNVGRETLENVLHTILSCKRVASSSLHGIIFAHAYGIPCLPIKFPGTRCLGLKFVDHYHSIGRYEYRHRFLVQRQLLLNDWIQHVDGFWQPNYPLDYSALLASFPLP